MPNRIFNTVLNRKIDSFVQTFIEDSGSIFYDKNKLIHPGEYGKYRESSLKEMLRLITKHKISDGFIITPNDKVSNQLDVIIYKNDEFPLLENNHVDFFSIESTIAIGEVKSSLSKANFIEALQKLAKNKMLHDDKQGVCNNVKYQNPEHDDLISFLVCASTTFEISQLNFDEIYDGIELKYRHNFVLILEEGLIGYQFPFNKLNNDDLKIFMENDGNPDALVWYEYPFFTFNGNSYKTNNISHSANDEDKYYHIKLFLTMLSQSLGYKNLYETSFVSYLNLQTAPIFNK